jgi:hypothetical protein
MSTVPFHPTGEFGKYLTLINIVSSFNHLQPLNPEPGTDQFRYKLIGFGNLIIIV